MLSVCLVFVFVVFVIIIVFVLFVVLGFVAGRFVCLIVWCSVVCFICFDVVVDDVVWVWHFAVLLVCVVFVFFLLS